MTPDQKRIVQETWRQVLPISEAASALFYDRLFELDPALRPLFDGVDLPAQRKKLMQAIATVVGGLENLDAMVPQISALGRRHADYGVTDGHYETVGAALLWTLEQGLGDAWTRETEAAWTAAYTAIAGIMREAANDALPAADAAVA